MIVDLRQHRKIIGVILFLVVGICVLLLAGRKFSSDITDMLPEHSVAAEMLKHLQEENVSGRFTIELRLRDGDNNPDLLPQAVTRLEALLKHPEIISVFSGFAMPSPEELSTAYTALPLLADKTDMAEIARLAERKEIDRTMRRNFLRLVAPGGMEFSRFIENDPLGLNRLVMKKLELFSHIISYRTAPGSAMLIGPDRRRAIVIVETAIPVADSKRAASFLAFLDEVTGRLSDRLSARVLCGHKHTLGNEKIIAADIRTVSIASLIIFVVLFALIYRRSPSSFLIVLMPMVAVLISVTVMAAVMNHVSAFVIGLGGVMAGISVDYGIHVYALCCQAGGDRVRELRKIVRPLCAGALTTIAVFIAFLFAGVITYTQLGIFAILCVVLSLALALYVLPNLLPDRLKSPVIRLNTPVFTKRGAGLVILVWSVIIVAAAILAFFGSVFDSSVTSLDGAGSEVINAEKDFNAYWSKQEMPAILAIKGNNREDVLRAGENLAAIAAESGIAGLVSPVMLTPSASTVRHRRAAWREFWSPDRIKETGAQIIASGCRNGFRADAFSSFNAWLAAGLDSQGDQGGLLAGISDKLLKRTGDKWTLTSFMADTPENFTAVKKMQHRVPGLRVISPHMLRDSIGSEVLGRLRVIGAAGLLAVLLLSVLATGGPVLGLIALVPVIAAMTVICGALAGLHLPLTIPVCVAMIIIVGLSIDYGIFMVFRCFKSLPDDVMSSVMLCAVTTAAGAATLLFAVHPVMFKLGITLFAGILVSCAAAVTLIPALAVMLKGKHKTWLGLLAVSLTLLCGGGCAFYSSLPEPGPLLAVPPPRAYHPPDRQWRAVSSLTFLVFGQTDTLLCAAEFDAVDRSGSIVCMQPTGMKMLEASFSGDRLSYRFIRPELVEHGIKVEDVVRDLTRLSFDNLGAESGGTGPVYEFDPATGMLLSKKMVENGRWLWKISFRQYKLIDGYSVPLEMRLDNRSPAYSLLIKVKEFSIMQPNRKR